jgi:hypothetical protein
MCISAFGHILWKMKREVQPHGFLESSVYPPGGGFVVGEMDFTTWLTKKKSTYLAGWGIYECLFADSLERHTALYITELISEDRPSGFI